MTTELTQLTPEEIAYYRSELAGNPDASLALDVIDECEGYLEDAAILIAMRESEKEPDRGLDLEELANKSRGVICSQPATTVFELVNILTNLLGTTGVVIAVVLFILKRYGLDKFCENSD